MMNTSKILIFASSMVLPLAAYALNDGSGGVAGGSGLGFEELIVTATSRPKAKIETTNATTTFSEEKLTQLAPDSVVELVRSIPGFHAEDTGGETGNNIAPRGFPLSTQTEFTALLRDGMTVFYNQDVLFSQSDRFTRFSSFVGDVEAVRGGASSIFVGSAPAGFINLLSREGSQNTEGDLAFETNSNNRIGVKGWISGALNDQTTYAIGGWYRSDDSARNTGYTANQGGEINANIKYEFAAGNGFSKFEFNKQDDRSNFIVPQPLVGSTTAPATISGGPDIHDGTSGNSARARHLLLANTPSGDIDLDLADGNYSDVTYVGNTTKFDLNEDWTLKNQMRYTDLPTTFTGIINVGNAQPLADKAQAVFAENPALLADASVADKLFYQVRDAGSGVVLSDHANIDAFNGNGLGIDAGFWHRRVDARNFQNDLQLQNVLDGDSGSLYTTMGLFFSTIDGDVTDYRINTLQSVEPLPQRLDIVFIDENGADIASATYRGIQSGSHGFANITYRERTVAPYFDLEYETGDWTLNLGARYEMLDADGKGENGQDFAISTFASDTDTLNGRIELPFGSGSFRDFTLVYQELAWTAAANYKFNEELALFARYADGFRMPDVDEYMNINTMTTVEEIGAFNRSSRGETEPHATVMAELGLKYSGEVFSAFVTGYFASADDLFFNVPTVVDGAIVQRQAFRNTETYGIEAELTLDITDAWRVGMAVTYQSPEFVDVPPAEFIDANGDTGVVEINGNIPVRVPEHFGQLTTSYAFDNLSWGMASVHASYSWSGRRYADDANTAELPTYGMLNVGASVETDSGYYIRADLKNINNSTGLTEGDPRGGETVASQNVFFNARVVLPRNANLTVGRRF